jgi:MinD superfamily P-loop ATPase
MGVGENRLERIEIAGPDWREFRRLMRLPEMQSTPAPESVLASLSRVANNTWLRPRPVIDHSKCSRCGDCVERCPVKCITQTGLGMQIDLRSCADCGCCSAVCEAEAVKLAHVGVARFLRLATRREVKTIDVMIPERRVFYN